MQNNIDKAHLRRVIEEEPMQFAGGFAAAENVKVDGAFDTIMLSGMGGSALPGNILRIYLHDLFARGKKENRLAVYQNRFYALPPESYHRCLNIFDSYSGNTEETIAAFDEALLHKLPMIGMSSGGKIEQLCAQNTVPFVKLPMPYPDFQPRMALGYVFAAMVQVLVQSGIIHDCRNEILTLEKTLAHHMHTLEEQGKALAQKLVGTTPIVYASTKFKALAMIWKIKINENSKVPAFWNFFPELNHNEMVGFTNPQAKFHFIFLRDADDHPKNLARYDVLEKLFVQKGFAVDTITLEGNSAIEKTFLSVLYADWASYYLALSYGQDPTPVDMVEDFKKML